MKITKILVTLAMATVMISGVFAASPKAKKPTAAKGYTVYLDWQGAAVGAEIPEWVTKVVSAGSEEELRTLVGKPDGYRVWFVQARGEDLDALKILTDNFDIQAEVARSISQNIAQAAKRHQETVGATASASVKEQTAAVETLSTVNVTLQGLETVSRYWTKSYRAQDKKGKKLLPGENPNGTYMYIVVMGMKSENFEKQLKAAMANIEGNTSQSPFLRQLSSLVIADLIKPNETAMSSSITGDLTLSEE